MEECCYDDDDVYEEEDVDYKDSKDDQVNDSKFFHSPVPKGTGVLLEPFLQELNLLLEFLCSQLINLLQLYQVLLVCLHLLLVIGVIYLSLIAI